MRRVSKKFLENALQPTKIFYTGYGPIFVIRNSGSKVVSIDLYFFGFKNVEKTFTASRFFLDLTGLFEILTQGRYFIRRGVCADIWNLIPHLWIAELVWEESTKAIQERGAIDWSSQDCSACVASGKRIASIFRLAERLVPAQRPPISTCYSTQLKCNARSIWERRRLNHPITRDT